MLHLPPRAFPPSKMNIITSPQLNGGQYGVQQQPISNNSSFHYLIIVVSVFLECILLLVVVVAMVLGLLTHLEPARPCIAAIHYTMKIVWASGF